MSNQDKIFIESEGDNWFDRNRDNLQTKDDLTLFLIDLYRLHPKKILEVGASNGFRLAELHNKFQSGVYALEPSKKAIEEGSKRWPFIQFQEATAADMQYEEHSFDLVIIHHVLHWVSRDTLLKSIANIDRVLNWKGYLVLGDFQTPFPIKRRYHHTLDQEVFTYKLDYKEIFKSTGFYKEVATLSRDHDQNIPSGEVTIDAYASTSLLRKEELYQEQ